MPYAFKAFCFLLIIFNVDLVCPVENCVKLRWNNTFNFSFYPNDGSSFMQSRVRNFIRYCLENLTGETLRSCKKPAVEGNFPLISGAPNISLEMLHRPVLATKEASAGTAVQILHAFEEIWQLFVLCLLAAILSGILIWFFDHKANSGHFPNSFWSGIREGLWWAIVTMTTVGYGDKTPKSFLARAYASLWMIIGMLLISTFMAQISSSITADGLSPLNEIFGSRIGVPLGSRQFFLKYCYGAESVTEYSTEIELLHSLQTGDVDKIWLFDCKAKVHFNFMIVDVLEDYKWHPSIGVGIQLKNNSIPGQNFARCLQCFKERCLDMDNEELRGLGIPDDRLWSGMKDENSEMFAHGAESEMDNKDEPDVNCFDKYSRGKQRQQMKLASSQKHLSFMDYILLACGGVIIILLTIGALWNISGKV